MPTANVSLSKQQAAFIRQAIENGRFMNASEVVRAGLHLLATQEEHERLRLARLKKLVKEGFDDIDRGAFEVIDDQTVGGFLQSIRATRVKSRTK